MAITVSVECPVCGVLIGSRTLTRSGSARDVDGDFVRDPGQHVHFDTKNVRVTCANGHKLRFDIAMIVAREP